MITTISRKSNHNMSMSKAEKMDRYLESNSYKQTGQVVRKAVNSAFSIDLDTVSQKNYGNKLSMYDISVMETLRQSLNGSPESTELDDQIMNMTKVEVMDRYITFHNYSLTGAENRILINRIFGVNLDGISSIEHDKLSINSKGQWITQSKFDLFILSSSHDDVSLYVNTTDYFKEQTGSSELPDSLKQALIDLKFTLDECSGTYTYSNTKDESVSDAFKVQVIDAIIKTIETEYANV
jgi:hypothetical protein